jgi:esterase/lipase
VSTSAPSPAGATDATDPRLAVPDPAALPTPADLDPLARILYHASVGTDHALRTGLASAISAAMVAGTVRDALGRGGAARERRELEFYGELADLRDPEAVFVRPPEVAVRSTPGRGPGMPGGRVELLRFDSPFRTRNPEVRRRYDRHVDNRVARAQHWRHADGPRRTLCVIHGFGASPAWFNTAFFSLREFFAAGWDVLLYTLPLHGSRRTTTAAVNGTDLFAHGMSVFNEAMLHAVHDFRIFLDHLERTGSTQIGVTGLSLGGYTSALLAGVEERLDFAIPNAAVVHLPTTLHGMFPANATAAAVRALSGISAETLERALAVHSPLTYAPKLPRDRLMVVVGLGDRLAPPEQSLLLWEHWGRPGIQWFPGSHVIHLGRRTYLMAMHELMADRARSSP